MFWDHKRNFSKSWFTCPHVPYMQSHVQVQNLGCTCNPMCNSHVQNHDVNQTLRPNPKLLLSWQRTRSKEEYDNENQKISHQKRSLIAWPSTLQLVDVHTSGRLRSCMDLGESYTPTKAVGWPCSAYQPYILRSPTGSFSLFFTFLRSFFPIPSLVIKNWLFQI
jgi:hypothetical protein